jgi:hypothetical protein
VPLRLPNLGVWYPAGEQNFIGDVGIRAQRSDKLVLRGKASPLAPFCSHRPGRTNGRPFIVCNNCKKILNTYHVSAGEVRDR